MIEMSIATFLIMWIIGNTASAVLGWFVSAWYNACEQDPVVDDKAGHTIIPEWDR